jgi:PhzF family phenazine biosynthesis protein
VHRPFAQVDVFASVPYGGNPVAVVLDGAGLSSEEMQRFAHWTNLSETTFLMEPTEPEADYAVRIFTPMLELPFAGHPTLGTAHAWLEAGGRPRRDDIVVQECPAGLIRLRRSGEGLAFAAPPLVRSGPVEDSLVARLADMLGVAREDIVDSQWVDNGPGWVAVMLATPEQVLALRPTVDTDVGVVAPYPDGAEAAFEVRAFYPKEGATAEDPVTGSLNASLAQWLIDTGRANPPYVAAQGAALGRAGRVYISRDDDGTVWVGGGSITCITGHVEI